MDAVVDRIINAIRSHRYRFSSEMELQAGIERVLSEDGLVSEREVILSKTDRIDFMVGQVGIEVKINGTYSALIRQIQRYAHSGRLQAIVVVTVADTLGLKRSQIEGIRDPNADLVEKLEVDSGRIKQLAEAYLKQRGLGERNTDADKGEDGI